jgi:hypothetical protein
VAPVALGLAFAQNMPKTTTERIPTGATVKTEQLHGTVVYVEGNRLVVKMSSGDMRTFDVPEVRRFVIDGKEMRVGDLQPGTRLTATVTTTRTSITERTTTVGSGKVWFVSGNNVILTLPNNENRMYKVQESYRFIVDGQPASVHDLRKGMTVSAQKIVEEPKTEMASDVAVTGSAPPPPRPTPSPAPARVASAERAAPAPAPAPAPRPSPAPVAAPAPVEAAPAELPHTAGPVPAIGLIGLAFMSAGLVLRKVRS